MPGAAARAAAAGCGAWLGGPWSAEEPPPGLLRLDLDRAGAAADPSAEIVRPGGALAVDSCAEEWAASSVEIDRAARALPIAGPERGQVAIHWRPLGDLAERLLTTWTRLVGAALVTEPDPERVAQTIFWCRPTVLQGTAEELGALAEALLPVADRRPLAAFRSRFGRLRTLLVVGREPLPEDSPWRRLGAPIEVFEAPPEGCPSAPTAG